MDTVDVKDLPDPVAQAIQAMVDALRAQLAENKPGNQKQPGKLPVWPGHPIGSLTREEIYDDAA
jgi:hypothetical protein